MARSNFYGILCWLEYGLNKLAIGVLSHHPKCAECSVLYGLSGQCALDIYSI